MPNSNSARQALIRQIEDRRRSRVLTYFLPDRRGAQGQIAEDAVRPMYEHLLAIGPSDRIDLFLYSVGGHTDVPWRIVSMIRQFAKHFAVLVPYKAMSAATMISIGADEIVMGRKGELGPIDPKLSIQHESGGTAVQTDIAVEDIMSYVRFIREKAGLSDQAALVGPVSALTSKLPPWVLGQINRAHSHIRIVARKLLTSRGTQQAVDEQRIQVIVETLAERTFQHGHAIGRNEAKEIGLNVVEPDPDLELSMWRLFEEYEQITLLREPIEPRTFVPVGQDEHSETLTLGCVESAALAHHFVATMRGRNKRQAPPQLSLNLNLNLQLPPTLQPNQLPAAMQQVIQQQLQHLTASPTAD